MVSTLLTCCGIASALNPTLDISQYAHTAWTARDGAFRGIIQSIAQTPDGYLWLGTDSGLLRFDGVRFAPWSPPGSQRILGSPVSSLLVSRDGRLWIGTDKGMVSWKDGNLTSYPEMGGMLVGKILEDKSGTVWVAGQAGLTGWLCAIRNASVHCDGRDGSLGRVMMSLGEYGGFVWAGGLDKVWRWQPGTPRFFTLPPGALDLLSDGSRLVAATQKGLFQLVGEKLEPYPLAMAPKQFYATRMLRDRDGGIWIGTLDHGLLHVHQGRTDVFDQVDGLSGGLVYSLFEDREGDIWAATREGLDRFRNVTVPTASVKQGLSTGIRSVLAESDESIWLGTASGLDRWRNGQVTHYGKQSGLVGDPTQSLFRDDQGRTWASTSAGLNFFEGRFHSVTGVRAGSMWSIAGNAADLWVSSVDQGLLHLREGRLLEQIPWAHLGRHNDFATVLRHDPSSGGLWLGFLQGGIAYFKDDQIRAYTEADGLVAGLISQLHVDREGALWAAAAGGVSRVKAGRIATLSAKNGLPCDSVHWAMEDADDFLWLYTACGLVRIARTEVDAWVANPQHTIRTLVLDASDGVRLLGMPVSGYSPSVTRASDGKLWFVSSGGVSILDPHHLEINQLQPPVHIEQITADRKTQDASSNLRLPALTRDLEIDYTALSLVAPEKNRFRVKLEGYDPDWKDAGNDRKAFYTNLPPRNYRFRVMASNNSGVWNEAGAFFDFSIKPAYYQTSWFQALCAAAFLALLWGMYRYRLHQVAREFNMRMEERVGERTRLARDLHDTLLQGFQGLMLRLQALDDLLPKGEAKDELEQTLDRADQVVTESRKAVHDLRLSATVTNDLARAVRALGDELSGDDSATFGFLMEGHARELHPIVRDEVYRITREALRNAFSHAQAHHIEAEIIYAENLFRLRIRDDGEGIAPAILEDGRPGHYGLPGMRERAAEIGAKLDIWSGVGTGTEIDLSLAGSIAYGKRPGRTRLRVFPEKAE